MDSKFDMVEMMEKYNIVLKRVPAQVEKIDNTSLKINQSPDESDEVIDCILEKCSEKQFKNKRQKNPAAFINDYWKNGYHIRRVYRFVYDIKPGWIAKSFNGFNEHVRFTGTETLCDTLEEAVKAAVEAEVKHRQETNAMYEKAGLPPFYTEL